MQLRKKLTFQTYLNVKTYKGKKCFFPHPLQLVRMNCEAFNKVK
jgi:hypothetical protein